MKEDARLASPKLERASKRRLCDLHQKQPIQTKSRNHGHSPVETATALTKKGG
jgi:hypothetical protein